jgi:hypothetical protein
LKKRFLAAIMGGALVAVVGIALAVPAFSHKKLHKPKPGDGPAMEVLDSVRIPWEFRFSELSGLAWDQDEQLLYAVSDLGHIVHFKVAVADNHIASVEPVFYGPLTLSVGQEKFFDTEDLVAINSANGKKGDSEIAVVFEDGPAAARFTATGQFIESIPLPGPLVDRANYRQVNQRLESIALTPDHGYIMAPQTPLVGEPRSHHTLYATDGKTWRFKAIKRKRTSTKALEQMPDGSLLVLEALNDGGFLGAIGLGGKEAHIGRLDPVACQDPRKCRVTYYPTASGEPIRGRFEGMTNISGDLFLLCTDETFGSALMLVRIPSPR